MKKEKIFHDLSSKEQNNIRKEYKDKYNSEYRYSIRLYVLYVIFGIFTLLGILLMNKNFLIGCVISVLGFIFMFINIYFLNLSNQKFYKYLRKLGYKYNKKR